MRNTKKWFVGLAVLALLVWGVSALAAAPKIHRGDNPHMLKNWQNRIDGLKSENPAIAAKHDAVLNGHPQAQGMLTKNGTPEAYALSGFGYSEGWADHIATNGKVVVWSNDTVFGNFTFAPANDMAHPTSYYVGYGFAPTYPDSMQFVGDMLYVDNGGYDILEFDCSDPANVQLIADYDMSCYLVDGIEDFKVKNGYIYVAGGADGFLIYAVGNPTFPAMVGNYQHASQNWGLYAFDPAGPWWIWPMHIDVTDDTMILIDDSIGYGAVYCWDITNMVDPIHTVLPYRGGAVYGNYVNPLDINTWAALFWSGDLGLPYFEAISQVKYISGWLFVSNSLFTGNLGLSRFDWSDESHVDTFLNLYGAPYTINDGFVGRARNISQFAIVGTGSFAFVSYEDVRDPGPPFGLPDINADAGEKWDWSVWNNPISLIVYKMDRFFYNNVDNFQTGLLGYNVFYGGAGIQFYSPSPGIYRTYIAGYNYVAAFDDSGMMVDHYVTGMDPQWWPFVSVHTPWPAQPAYKMPSASSVWNFVMASDDSFALVWEPEGVYVMDTNTGMRVGFWEMQSRADFVRNVDITSDNHYALVSCGSLGLVTLDLSDITNPVKVGNWWTNPTSPTSFKQPVSYVFINGRYAYVQTRVLAVDALNPTININVVRVLDISNPPLPAEVAAYTAPVTGLEWDVNHMELANAYSYMGRVYIQISNGQGLDTNGMYEPAYTNCPAWNNYAPASRGSFIVGDISNPAAIANRFNVPLAVSTYASMSCFYVPTNSSNYWAYIADGIVEIVDMGDPASGLLHTYVRASYDPYGYGTVDPLVFGYPTYVDKVWRVYGFDQIGTSYVSPYAFIFGVANQWDHWDVSLPLAPFFIPSYGSNAVLNWGYGYWWGQMSDNTWVSTTLFGDVFYYSNKADYVPPAFSTGGPMADGWWTPYCGSSQCGIINAPMTLKVQVIDNVAVTRVRMRAYFVNGDNWDGCYPGYVTLGNAQGPDANNFWTLTIDPSMFWWTGWVRFRAFANDAGGNIISQWNNGGDWYVAAQPAISVEVGPAGTDAPYVWSTTTVAAQVTPVVGDVHIVRVLFKVDGLSIGDGIYNPSTDRWYTNWNTTQVGDGNHTVTAEVTTSNSAVAVSAPVTKYVANGGPDSYIIKPVAGQMVYGSTVCSAALTDPTYPVPMDSISFVLDRPAGATSGGTVIGSASAPVSPGGPYEITYDFSQIPDGNHTLVAIATDVRWDGTHRSKPSSWVSFSKVTPQPMTVTIAATPTNPTDAQTVAFTSTVTGGITPYTYTWSSTPAGLAGTGPSAAYRFPAGSYTITLVVKDALGTEKTATMSLTVTSAVAITSIQKKNDANGFRLIVNGYGFVSGCVVKINGSAVTTKFKGANQVVAKNCKSLCPKGTAVQVTVTNPDGSTSPNFSFTR